MEQEFKKVNFAEYEGKYNADTLVDMEINPEEISIETMRECMYGYTFTEDFAQNKYPDELSMDYWKKMYDEDCEAMLEYIDINDVDWEDSLLEDNNEEEEIDMYEVDTPQERLLLQTIDSTGDGRTPETALCVIHVANEYEYLDRVFPFYNFKVIKQTVDNGIDCLHFAPNTFDIECIYFDIHRWFDVHAAPTTA